MAKRMELASEASAEFAPTVRLFVETASQFFDEVVKEVSWCIALLKAQKVGESLAPFWPQTPSCPCTGLRELEERMTVCNTIVLFCDNHAIDVKAKGFGEVCFSELTFLPDVVGYIDARCPC